jgi:hypothetical protein
MSLEFYQTVGGRQFIDGTMKNIARSLERIADALEEQNKSGEGEPYQECSETSELPLPSFESMQKEMAKFPHADNHMD